jgi:hypothetical protein
VWCAQRELVAKTRITCMAALLFIVDLPSKFCFREVTKCRVSPFLQPWHCKLFVNADVGFFQKFFFHRQTLLSRNR